MRRLGLGPRFAQLPFPLNDPPFTSILGLHHFVGVVLPRFPDARLDFLVLLELPVPVARAEELLAHLVLGFYYWIK